MLITKKQTQELENRIVSTMTETILAHSNHISMSLRTTKLDIEDLNSKLNKLVDQNEALLKDQIKLRNQNEVLTSKLKHLLRKKVGR